MTYAYYLDGRHNDPAVFDLYFRKCPFGGEFCVFAGLDEVSKHLSSFRFTPSDIRYLQTLLPSCRPDFWSYLSSVDCSSLTVTALHEGTVCFPRVPLLRVRGPLAVGQLLETTLLTLVNYPSLVTTNAARFRLAAPPGSTLLEFGLRRAQGPDGGFSASKYCVEGGFDGTSNVLAGKELGVSVKGTHAHAFVMVYGGLEEVDEERCRIKGKNIKVSARQRVRAVVRGFAQSSEGARSRRNHRHLLSSSAPRS